MRKVIVAALAFAALAACEEKKKEAEDKPLDVLEAIALAGTCREDHVADAPENVGEYQGSVAKTQFPNGQIYLFGWMLTKNMGDPKKIYEQALNPGRYFPADTIEIFTPAPADTSVVHMTLKGTSDRGTEEQRANDSKVHGYATTCELDVTERGKTLAEVDPNVKAMDKMLQEHPEESQ
jgi:hypothetical protein